MSLYPKAIEAVLAGIPRGPSSNVYFVDTVNGDDTALGDRWTKPLATVTTAYGKCTTDQHDVVVLLGMDTADTPAATLTWSKDFTHLVGLTNDLYGVGQRARIVGNTTYDLAPIVTFSGKGCIVKNIQFFNGGDADADAGAVDVSGGRNYFENCMISGMGHATPGARAGSYSLEVSGGENVFKRCYIGLDTIIRASTNAELVLASGAVRNYFDHCIFASYSETAGKFMVRCDNGIDRWQIFEDCLFYNFWVNWVDQLTNAFDMDAAATHYVILRGANQLVGIDGWADTVTHLYSAAPQPNAGFGVSTNPTS